MGSATGTLNHLSRDVRDIGDMLGKFSASAQVFSSNSPRLIDVYENKWVGVYNGNIEAVADSLAKLIEQVEQKNIPPGETMVRFINRERKTLIL